MKLRFFYVLIFSFVFISSFTIIISELRKTYKEVLVQNSEDGIYASEIQKKLTPVLSSKEAFPVFSAESVLAVDLTSGTSLFEKNPDEKLLPASTTKIITALVALDHYSLDASLKVGNIKVDGQKMKLIPGEEITVRDLIYGLLVFSANDAAEVLAENYCTVNSTLNEVIYCGRQAFIDAMNGKAAELNLENTLFANPTGLENERHMSTASDLVRASSYAMQNPFFREVVSTKETTVRSLDGEIAHKLVNINELVGEVDGVLGVKTGWTENAHENLITYIERDGKRIMIAVLASEDRFGETKELINWIFRNYQWELI